jgi:hypothetical protein
MNPAATLIPVSCSVFTKKLKACSVRSQFIDNSLLIGGVIAMTSYYLDVRVLCVLNRLNCFTFRGSDPSILQYGIMHMTAVM